MTDRRADTYRETVLILIARSRLQSMQHIKMTKVTGRMYLFQACKCVSQYCVPLAHVAICQHLRSAVCDQLTVPRNRLSTYDRHAFAAVSHMTFNAMPDHLRDPSFNTAMFARSVKTHLFTTYQHA